MRANNGDYTPNTDFQSQQDMEQEEDPYYQMPTPVEDNIQEQLDQMINDLLNQLMQEMKKNPSSKGSKGITITDNVIVWDFIFVFVATIIIISYINLKFKFYGTNKNFIIKGNFNEHIIFIIINF